MVLLFTWGQQTTFISDSQLNQCKICNLILSENYNAYQLIQTINNSLLPKVAVTAEHKIGQVNNSLILE